MFQVPGFTEALSWMSVGCLLRFPIEREKDSNKNSRSNEVPSKLDPQKKRTNDKWNNKPWMKMYNGSPIENGWFFPASHVSLLEACVVVFCWQCTPDPGRLEKNNSSQFQKLPFDPLMTLENSMQFGAVFWRGATVNQNDSGHSQLTHICHTPGDSMRPFHPLVGGHVFNHFSSGHGISPGPKEGHELNHQAIRIHGDFQPPIPSEARGGGHQPHLHRSEVVEWPMLVALAHPRGWWWFF